MLSALGDRIPWLVFAVVALALLGAGFIDPIDRRPQVETVQIAELAPPPSNASPDRNEWRQEQDLRAQWDQARWAQAAAVAGFLSVLVTGVGIIFVRATLEATRRATEIATRNAEIAQSQATAAIESNALNRSALLAEQRPWIRLELEVAGPLWFTEGGVQLAVRCKMANLGRTPAISCAAHIEMVIPVGPHNPYEMQQKAVERALPLPFGVTVFPNDTRSLIPQASADEENVKAAQEHSAYLRPVVTAAIVYGSSMDEAHHRTAIQVDVFRRKLVISPSGAVIKDTIEDIRWDGGDVPADDLVLIESSLVPGHAD